MSNHPNQPRLDDAVFGGQAPPPVNAVVLGGIEGVKRTLSGTSVEHKITALKDALKYGKEGLELVVIALKDLEPIQKIAYDLLIKYTQNSRILKALWAYQPILLKPIETPYLKQLTILAFSPDGQNLLIGDRNGTIKVLYWQMAQRSNIKAEQPEKCHEHEYSKEISTYKGYLAGVISISWSQDGQALVSTSQGTTIDIRSLDGKKIHNFNFLGHHKNITAIAFTPDSQILVSGFDFADQTVKVWNLRNGSEICNLGSYLNAKPLTFSPDGKTLVINCRDQKTRLWNLQTGQNIHTLKGHLGVTSAAFNFDGTILATSSRYGVQVWDVETGEEICTLTQDSRHSSGDPQSVAFSPDGKTIVSGYYWGTSIMVWSI